MSRDSHLDVVVPARGLIGRVEEQKWLSARLDEARRGQPQVVVLRGEAGIGKSRLARALVEQATDSGFATSIGRFRELPGLPFDAFIDDLFPRLAEAMANDPTQAGAAEILAGLGTFGSRDADGVAPSESERIAAIRGGFMHLVRRAPLMLLVDDVQWADAGSLELIVNLVRLAADVRIREPFRLLTVLVVRDEPGVPEIAELDLIRREDVTASLTLHGLTELDVSRLARATGARELPLGVVDELVRVTRGNPLFVLALVNQLAPTSGGSDTSALVVPPRLPAEVQTLLGSRVTALSPECRAALTAAAVLGSNWDLAQLQAVTATDRDRLAELVDEAESAEILSATGASYEFAHPLYERAVLATLSSGRLRAMHQRIAEVLIEAHAHDPSSSVMPVAQHLLAAGELGDPAVLHAFFDAAGERAYAASAWAESAKYTEAAMRAAEQLAESTAAAKVTMSLRASRARLQSGEPQAARRNADAAIAALGADPSPESSAVVWIERLRADLFEPTPEVPIDTAPLEGLVAALDPASPGVAARAYSTLAPAYWATRRVEDAREACFRAIDLGSGCGEHVACAEAWVQLAMTQWMRLELDDAVTSLSAATREAVASGDPQKVGLATTRMPLTLAWLGRFDDAADAMERAWRTTREVGYSLADGLLLVAQALISSARGMHMDAEVAAEDAIEIGRVTGYHWATSLALPILASTLSLRGDDVGMDAVLERWAPPDSTPDRTAFGWLLHSRSEVAAGRPPSRSEVEDVWRLFASFASFAGMSVDTAAVLVIELAADIDEPDLAAEPAAFLADLAARGQLFTTTMGLFIPRALGIATACAGDRERAEGELGDAIERAGKLRAHAEVAQCQWALARVVGASGDRDKASQLLERAARGAHAMGLLALVHRCESLRQTLGLPASVSPDRDGRGLVSETDAVSGFAVVLFTDIADSVRLTEELGDWVFHDRALDLRNTCNALIRDFAGRPVEGIKLGDGVLAEFGSAERAVGCALACSSHASEVGMPLHIGVHAGDVIRDGGDVFGGAVNIAARICAEAPSGEVFVSRTIRDIARTSTTAAFTPIGARALKGIAEPVPLYAVRVETR